MNSIIALIDMDCFFVQVEQRSRPETLGTPCAVTQYNTYKGGGIIAVNYEARSAGVTRQMRGDDAKLKCPNITLFHTPQKRGKADSSKYREASLEVFNVLTNFNKNITIEKASIDEAYLNLTSCIENDNLKLPDLDELKDCFIEGNESNELDKNVLFETLLENIVQNKNNYINEKRLLLGAKLIFELRNKILEETKFHCSAGISFSKTMAKLAAGMHKPKSQTIIPINNIKNVLAKTPIQKLRNFGGKLGLEIKVKLDINFVDEINNFEMLHLKTIFGEKTSKFIKNMANGIDDEEVKSRKSSKSIGCGKNFSAVGTNSLTEKNQVQYWITQLVDELLERLNNDCKINKRRPTLLIVSFHQEKLGSQSKSLPFSYFNKEKLIDLILNRAIVPIIFKKENFTKNPLRMLSISATKFTDAIHDSNKLDTFFLKNNSKDHIKQEKNNHVINNKELKKIDLIPMNSKQLMKSYFQEMETDIYNTHAKKKNTILTMFEDNLNQNLNNSIQGLSANDCKRIREDNLNNNFSNLNLIETNYNHITSECSISNQANQTQSANEQTEPFLLDSDRKEVKRGFFYRKMMELNK